MIYRIDLDHSIVFLSDPNHAAFCVCDMIQADSESMKNSIEALLHFTKGLLESVTALVTRLLLIRNLSHRFD
jgi:hypothetical protein